MDRLISSEEAAARFAEMLRDVAQGESYTVTDGAGGAVARVVPPPAARRTTIAELVDDLRRQPIRHAGPWTREDLYD